MTEQKKVNGGPAFPGTFLWQDEESAVEATGSKQGMSLRDYFASQAMLGLVTGNTTAERPIIDESNYAFIAKQSYEMADAMLKIRGDA